MLLLPMLPMLLLLLLLLLPLSLSPPPWHAARTARTSSHPALAHAAAATQ
jgi:hypothetical protein